MILVINSGSSSIKFKLFDHQERQVWSVAEGLAERIGIDGKLKIIYQNQEHRYEDSLPNHEAAIKLILDGLIKLNAIHDINEISGVGFRVVHGGKISASSIITPEIYQQIKDNVKLAPLHNPGALIAIDAVKKNMPKAKLVACFDTAFHQTMEEVNYLYPVPYN
jgi:acetate kinase